MAVFAHTAHPYEFVVCTRGETGPSVPRLYLIRRHPLPRYPRYPRLPVFARCCFCCRYRLDVTAHEPPSSVLGRGPAIWTRVVMIFIYFFFFFVFFLSFISLKHCAYTCPFQRARPFTAEVPNDSGATCTFFKFDFL